MEVVGVVEVVEVVEVFTHTVVSIERRLSCHTRTFAVTAVTPLIVAAIADVPNNQLRNRKKIRWMEVGERRVKRPHKACRFIGATVPPSAPPPCARARGASTLPGVTRPGVTASLTCHLHYFEVHR